MQELLVIAWRKEKIEMVVMFGMNIDNEEHIIRDVMSKYSDMFSKDFKTVYCYFTEENRDVLIEQYKSTILFRKDVSYRVKQIELFIYNDAGYFINVFY